MYLEFRAHYAWQVVSCKMIYQWEKLTLRVPNLSTTTLSWNITTQISNTKFRKKTAVGSNINQGRAKIQKMVKCGDFRDNRTSSCVYEIGIEKGISHLSRSILYWTSYCLEWQKFGGMPIVSNSHAITITHYTPSCWLMWLKTADFCQQKIFCKSRMFIQH